MGHGSTVCHLSKSTRGLNTLKEPHPLRRLRTSTRSQASLASRSTFLLGPTTCQHRQMRFASYWRTTTLHRHKFGPFVMTCFHLHPDKVSHGNIPLFFCVHDLDKEIAISYI